MAFKTPVGFMKAAAGKETAWPQCTDARPKDTSGQTNTNTSENRAREGQRWPTARRTSGLLGWPCLNALLTRAAVPSANNCTHSPPRYHSHVWKRCCERFWHLTQWDKKRYTTMHAWLHAPHMNPWIRILLSNPRSACPQQAHCHRGGVGFGSRPWFPLENSRIRIPGAKDTRGGGV